MPEAQIQAGFHQLLLHGHQPELRPWRVLPQIATLKRPPLEYRCCILVNPQGPVAAWQEPVSGIHKLLYWAQHMPSAGVALHLFIGQSSLLPCRTVNVFELKIVEMTHQIIPKYALIGLVDALDGMPDAVQQWQQDNREALARNEHPCRIVESTRLIYTDAGVAASNLLGFVQVQHLPSSRQAAGMWPPYHTYDADDSEDEEPPLSFEEEYQDLGGREKALLQERLAACGQSHGTSAAVAGRTFGAPHEALNAEVAAAAEASQLLQCPHASCLQSSCLQGS